jgi:hypothetical protein
LKHVLTDPIEAVLEMGLNFLAIYSQSILDMAYAVETVVMKLPQALGMEFRWKIRFMVEKS